MQESTLAPRELAKLLLRCSSARSLITDCTIPLQEAVYAVRCGAGGSCGPGYWIQVRGLHIEVSESQGQHHEPPIRFTVHEIASEMRAEALSPCRQLALW